MLDVLKPLNVPWQISPSAPFLQFRVAEFEPSSIAFSANVLAEDKGVVCASILVILSVSWIRVNPSFGEGRVIDESRYDWSQVKFHNQFKSDIGEWTEQFRLAWENSGICPISGAYEVVNSTWKSTLPPHVANDTHLLFVGEERSIECIVKDWKWEIIRLLDKD